MNEAQQLKLIDYLNRIPQKLMLMNVFCCYTLQSHTGKQFAGVKLLSS